MFDYLNGAPSSTRQFLQGMQRRSFGSPSTNQTGVNAGMSYLQQHNDPRWATLNARDAQSFADDAQAAEAAKGAEPGSIAARNSPYNYGSVARDQFKTTYNADTAQKFDEQNTPGMANGGAVMISPDPHVPNDISRAMKRRNRMKMADGGSTRRFDPTDTSQILAAENRGTFHQVPNGTAGDNIAALPPQPMTRRNEAPPPSAPLYKPGAPEVTATSQPVPGIYEGKRGYHGERVFSDNPNDPALTVRTDQGRANPNYEPDAAKRTGLERKQYGRGRSDFTAGPNVSDKTLYHYDFAGPTPEQSAAQETRVLQRKGFDPTGYVASGGRSAYAMNGAAGTGLIDPVKAEELRQGAERNRTEASRAAGDLNARETSELRQSHEQETKILKDNPALLAGTGLNEDEGATLLLAKRNPDSKALKQQARAILGRHLQMGVNANRDPVDYFSKPPEAYTGDNPSLASVREVPTAFGPGVQYGGNVAYNRTRQGGMRRFASSVAHGLGLFGGGDDTVSALYNHPEIGPLIKSLSEEDRATEAGMSRR